MTKQCVRCEKLKPIDQFSIHRHTKDGLNSWCKECMIDRQRERKMNDHTYHQKQKEYARSYQLMRKTTEPGYRQVANARTTKYARKRKAADPKYHQKCKQQIAECNDTRRINDPTYRAKRYAYTRCRSRGLRKQFKALSIEEQKAIYEFYLNCPEGHEVDHIYPVIHGGLHCLSNLQYLPASENSIKGHKIPPNTDIDGTKILY